LAQPEKSMYAKPAPAVATVLIVGVIVAATGAFALTIASNLLVADIRVYNQGCGDLPLAAALGPNGSALVGTPLPGSLGITLPEEIGAGDSAMLSLPPLRVKVDNATEPAEFRIRILGVERTLTAGKVTGVVFDGVSLLKRQTVINLDPNGQHDLTIICTDYDD
jgi:hypothetical protein